MATAVVPYQSRSLGKSSAFSVILPEESAVPRPWATLYLLHGLHDDHTTWLRRTGIERYVAGLPLVVVMPDAGRGFYTNAVAGSAYEDDLIGDVMAVVERTYPVRAGRAGRAIGGLSMGGYGAVKLALKHPTMFASAHSHSGALGVTRPEVGALRDLFPEFARVFGAEPTDGPDDPYALAARVDRDLLPALRLDCGTEDFLLGQSRAFHARLDALAIPHEYHEGRGGHDWDYWDHQIRHAITFHKRNLGLD